MHVLPLQREDAEFVQSLYRRPYKPVEIGSGIGARLVYLFDYSDDAGEVVAFERFERSGEAPQRILELTNKGKQRLK